MAFKHVLVVVLSLILVAEMAKPKRKNYRNNKSKQCVNNDIANNLTALWTKVNAVAQPIKVYVHGDGAGRCDSYYGCGYGGHHSHNHGSHQHGSHGHGSHKHGAHASHKHGAHASHKHGAHASHKHGAHASHKHGSHSSHHHGSHSNKNHLHIYLSVNGKDDMRTATYRPKDEFVYARCDMEAVDKKGLPVKGSILMRQKPHKAIETMVNLRGFKGASEGIKDGKHDYFFDIHPFADFTQGCDSFGAHDHVHEHKEGDGHDHGGHQHGSGDKHSHGGHDHGHHHLSSEDDWGNVIINAMGKAKMEVNTTRHELFGPESILGRGIVLHDKDDKTVCCCAITYANIKDEDWAM